MTHHWNSDLPVNKLFVNGITENPPKSGLKASQKLLLDFGIFLEVTRLLHSDIEEEICGYSRKKGSFQQ